MVKEEKSTIQGQTRLDLIVGGIGGVKKIIELACPVLEEAGSEKQKVVVRKIHGGVSIKDWKK